MSGAAREARESLFGFVESGAEEGDLPTFAAALDAYAHELAEEIRKRPFVAHYGHGTFDEGSSSAADLIDPEVG